MQLNSQSATEWQKDGSLVVDIENTIDGNDGVITATRTVRLGFDRPGQARILKSTIAYDTGAEDLDPKVRAARGEKGDLGNDFAAYYHRGCANFVKRDWAKALADFQRHCELRKEEANQVFAARFYIWLIRARLGDREAADKELAPYMEGHPAEWGNGWDAKTGNFLLGKLNENDFLAALSDNPGEAWFYAGMNRLINKDQGGATDAFNKSVAMGDKKADTYPMAAAELKALAR